MNPNPFKSLLHSRKFWLLIFDVLVSVVLYFAGKYAGASAYEDIKFLILSLQPVFVTVIIGIFAEDNAKLGAGSTPPVQ
jgi:hypothetical protein